MALGLDREPFRVLVVDDDPRELPLLAAALSTDFAVTPSASPVRSLEMLKSESFHVICTNFEMSEMKGVDFVTRVSEADGVTSFVIVSGLPDRTERLVEDLGLMVAVVAQPYDAARLVRLTEQLARLTEVKRSLTRLRRPAPHKMTGRDS